MTEGCSSQFVSFLDLIAFRLQRAGFTVRCLSNVSESPGADTKLESQICRLEGGMTPQQRDATIQHFSESCGLLMSAMLTSGQ